MSQEQQQQVSISIHDLIYAQVKDLGKRMDRLEKNLDVTRNELNARMDRIERRQDKFEEKIDALDKKVEDKIDRLDKKVEDKIDRLASKIDSSSNHGQIATISSIGIGLSAVSITLGVLYALIFK